MQKQLIGIKLQDGKPSEKGIFINEPNPQRLTHAHLQDAHNVYFSVSVNQSNTYFYVGVHKDQFDSKFKQLDTDTLNPITQWYYEDKHGNCSLDKPNSDFDIIIGHQFDINTI